jgi:hypothetical protein
MTMERERRVQRERNRNEPAVATADPVAQTASLTREANVQVIYGASVQTLALAGLTLAEARPFVETILSVAPRSPALVNGRPVRASYVIAEGDALEFVHHAGEKGSR